MSELIELSNFIAGEWRAASCGHWIDDYAPATGEHVARIPCSSSEDIDAAVDAALGGFGPPAQGQADGFAAAALAPCLRPAQRMAEAQVLAAPGPDHQSAGIPVRAVALTPAVVQGW